MFDRNEAIIIVAFLAFHVACEALSAAVKIWGHP